MKYAVQYKFGNMPYYVYTDEYDPLPVSPEVKLIIDRGGTLSSIRVFHLRGTSIRCWIEIDAKRLTSRFLMVLQVKRLQDHAREVQCSLDIVMGYSPTFLPLIQLQKERRKASRRAVRALKKLVRYV